MPFIFALSIAYIAERFDRGTSTEISALFVAGTTLGGFAGRFATNLMTSIWGWRHALDVVAALCLVTGVAIYASLPASGAIARRVEHVADSRAGPSWRIVTRGPLLASFAIGACVLASQVATFTFVGLRWPARRSTSARSGSARSMRCFWWRWS